MMIYHVKIIKGFFSLTFLIKIISITLMFLFRNQIMEDIDLMATTCPNLRKVNLVIHYKIQIMDIINTEVIIIS